MTQARCYRCGSFHELTCCETCHKYMCPKCKNDHIRRAWDAAWEKTFGFSKDWYPEGRC